MIGKEPLLILAGPTAVGKTNAAVQLCQKFQAEVVSADSVQVYRGLDVGSAKPEPKEIKLAPHHLIDVAEPTENFDAARFVKLADQAIADLQARGKRALVAGGTGLYIKALLHGLAQAPPVDTKLREKLSREWEEKGGQALHASLAKLDPLAGGRIHPADRQRVIRALEVSLQTGRPFSNWQAEHAFKEKRYDYLFLGLDRPRDELYKRIELRCNQMWQRGLTNEVQKLLDQGVPPGARSLQSLGYRHALMWLQGRLGQDEALALMVKDTKAYAKRQITWFRKINGINWHSPDDLSGIIKKVNAVWP